MIIEEISGIAIGIVSVAISHFIITKNKNNSMKITNYFKFITLLLIELAVFISSIIFMFCGFANVFGVERWRLVFYNFNNTEVQWLGGSWYYSFQPLIFFIIGVFLLIITLFILVKYIFKYIILD